MYNDISAFPPKMEIQRQMMRRIPLFFGCKRNISPTGGWMAAVAVINKKSKQVVL